MAMILLPFLHFSKRMSDPPHRHRLLAKSTDDRGVEYELVTNWPRTAWWLTATKDRYRMSSGRRTSSPRVATFWLKAMLANGIRLDRSGL